MNTSRFEKRDKRYPVSIESGTADVPDDGRYHVVDSGEIVLSTAVLEYAQIEFEERREAHRVAQGAPDPRELLARERVHKELRAMRGEGVASRGRRNRGGGPGGRGGT